jgi:molybdate transport system substrate-binding protein
MRATPRPRTRSASPRLPEGSHPPIRYPAAALESSTHPEAGDLLDYLASREAAKIFARHGFAALPGGR